MTLCTCEVVERHEIARRRTFDNIGVILWSDGTLTSFVGAITGLPYRQSARVTLRAGWLLMGEAELWNYDELATLYKACVWAAARDGLPGSVRAFLSKPAPLKPNWTVTATDNRNAPTERVWRLPRLRWPGLAVWDTCSAKQRYAVYVRIHGSNETYSPTGCAFATLTELQAYLEKTAAA
jgi:hypothetical protein